MKRKKLELWTVMVENVMLSKETGFPEKQGFILYSSPCTPAMAQALADQLKMVNKSYRIMTEDGKGVVVAEWLREGFVPTDKKGE